MEERPVTVLQQPTRRRQGTRRKTWRRTSVVCARTRGIISGSWPLTVPAPGTVATGPLPPDKRDRGSRRYGQSGNECSQVFSYPQWGSQSPRPKHHGEFSVWTYDQLWVHNSQPNQGWEHITKR